MKKENSSKMGGYIQFSMASAETSFITYNKVRLYYAKFKKQQFATLTEQYKTITGEDLSLNINGMALEEGLQIQEVIQTQEEQKVFQYLLEQSKQGSLELPRVYWLAFNTIVSRIISSGKYQEKLPPEQKSQFDNNCFSQSNQPQIPYLIYWVDDNPQNNKEVINVYLDPAKIMTVQVQSTEQMVCRLQYEYKVYKGKGTKILFISDMSRKEGEVMNQTAGIDLLKHIYHDLKLEEASIAYVSSKGYTLKSMAQKKLKMDAISVVNSQSELVKLIYQHFGISKK